MLRSLFLPAVALIILPATLALEWLGPLATPIPSLPDAQGFTPKPTKGPPLNVVAKSNPDLKLLRRQTRSIDFQTCGFVDGNEAYGITCGSDSACGYNATLSAFGCCSGTSTSLGNVYFTDSCSVDTLTTTCYPSTKANLCTGACTTNAQICSDSSAPICRTILKAGRTSADSAIYTLYGCVTSGLATSLFLQQSFSVSSSIVPDPLLLPGCSFDANENLDCGSTSTPSSATTTKPESDETDPPGPVPPPKNKKSKTGAIAGGVVGGLAGVGLITGALIWALMRKKEKARTEAAAVNEVSHTTYVHDGK